MATKRKTTKRSPPRRPAREQPARPEQPAHEQPERERPARPEPRPDALAVRPSFDPDHRVVAVTGAASFLGTELLKRLEADRRYLKVVAIDIRKPEPPGKAIFHKVDLTLPTADAELAQILKREQVDTLVHLAFLSHPTHNSVWAHELEAIGTLHVFDACAACKLHKVVLWSLTSLYGASPLNPNYLTEEVRQNGMPGSRFFNDKLEAERLALRFRKENPASVVTIVRTAAILGRRVSNYVSGYLSRPVVPVMMGYDPLVQLLHEDDAVAAFKLVVDADFNDQYNVAGDGVLPLSTALALLGRLPLPIPYSLAYPAAKVMWMTQVIAAAPVFLDFLRYLCVADTTKIRREMGFTPRHDIRAILADFAGLAPPHAAATGGPR
jgi:UDP-glucose 4-epimerase